MASAAPVAVTGTAVAATARRARGAGLIGVAAGVALGANLMSLLCLLAAATVFAVQGHPAKVFGSQVYTVAPQGASLLSWSLTVGSVAAIGGIAIGGLLLIGGAVVLAHGRTRPERA